jgi:VanZ family protein
MGYAVFDELHQIFIPGRSCQIKDMLIDSSGVLLAVLLCSVWVSMKVRGRKRVRSVRWNE